MFVCLFVCLFVLFGCLFVLFVSLVYGGNARMSFRYPVSPLSSAPSAPPQNVAVTDVTNSSLLLQWSPPAEEERNGLIQYYTITVTEEDTGRVIHFQSLSTKLWVQHLHPFYMYTCSVAALTVDVGPFSSPITVTTLESRTLHSVVK